MLFRGWIIHHSSLRIVVAAGETGNEAVVAES
jgi:hypothetical protein